MCERGEKEETRIAKRGRWKKTISFIGCCDIERRDSLECFKKKERREEDTDLVKKKLLWNYF